MSKSLRGRTAVRLLIPLVPSGPFSAPDIACSDLSQRQVVGALYSMRLSGWLSSRKERLKNAFSAFMEPQSILQPASVYDCSTCISFKGFVSLGAKQKQKVRCGPRLRDIPEKGCGGWMGMGSDPLEGWPELPVDLQLQPQARSRRDRP